MKALLVLLLMPIASFAGLRVVEKHEGWQLTVGTKVTAQASYEDCKAALIALGTGATGKCKDVTSLTVEATCEDLPKPILKPVLNADGFLVLPDLKVEALPDGSWGPTQEQGFVSAPYPACWTLGWVPYTGEWHAPDGPPSMDEGPWTYCVDYGKKAPYIGKTCPKDAHAGCYIPPNAPDVCP